MQPRTSVSSPVTPTRLSVLLSSIAQTPNLVRAVVGDQHRAISQYQQSNRPAPDVTTVLIEHPTRQKIVVAAHGFSILETNANELVAGSFGAIPRSMQGHENIALVFLREHFAFVKDQAQNRRMRLDQDITRNRFLNQVGSFAFVARIFDGAGIGVWPTVKTN